MTRKRRMFDIELPEDDAPTPEVPAPAAQRRGPMASAISKNAEALQARRSAAEAIREENDALAHEYVALREAGHVVQSVPLDEVHCYLLVRDRLPGDDMEMAELITSIRELGLSACCRAPMAPGSNWCRATGGSAPIASCSRKPATRHGRASPRWSCRGRPMSPGSIAGW